MTAQFRGILLGSAFAHFALAVTGAFFVAHLPFPKNEVSPVAVEIEVPQAAEPAPAFPPLPEVVKGELLSLPAVAHHEPRPITKAVRRLEVARSLRPVPAKSSSRRSKSEHAPSVPVSRHSDAGSVRASVQTPVHAAALPAASAGFPAGVPATASGDAPPRARIASAPAVPPSAGSGPAISHPAPVPVARKSPAIGRDYFVELIRVISAHRSYPRASLDNEEEGVVRVRMLLEPSGRLVESVLAESSGFARLDSAALETLRKIGKFPVPAGHAGNLSLLVPIEYRINP